MPTTRRTLMATALAGSLVHSARAQAPMALRISTASVPADFLAKSLEQLKSDVDQANAGLKVDVYSASSLFKQGTEVPALQRGNLEMSIMTTFEVAQQLPEYGYLNRGYLFRDYRHLRQVFDGPFGDEYRRVVSEKMGIEILATAYLGTRQVNLRHKRDVKGPDDLAGTKMRMPAGPEWLLLGRALGVSPVPMGAPEIYLALRTGTIDGQENPLSILAANKFYEVTEQVVLTAHMLQPVFLNIATPVWKKLGPEQQTVLRTASTRAVKFNDEGRLADEATILDMLKSKGMTVSAPDLAAFRDQADKVYGESSAAKAWDAAGLKRVIDTL